MGNYTREEILQMVEEEDVEFIRLQFTDMFGAIKNIAVTARELPRALNNQCIINARTDCGNGSGEGLRSLSYARYRILSQFCRGAHSRERLRE